MNGSLLVSHPVVFRILCFPFVKASAIFIKELLPNQLKVATIPLIVLVGDVVADSTMLNHRCFTNIWGNMF